MNRLRQPLKSLGLNRKGRRAAIAGAGPKAGPKARPANLKTEVADTKLGSVRSPWGDPSVVAGLTARKLAGLLRAAERGDTRAYLTLAEEMEEREPHYGSVLATRKRGVNALEPVVIAASEDKRDEEIAQAVRDYIVEKPHFEDLVDGLQDALGKGYAAVETIWDTGNMAVPLAYKRRDPRHFKLDLDDGETLRLITDGNPLGEDLEPYKWTIHRHKQKAGLSIRGGLARLASWSFLFKTFAIKDWASFIETYGQPLRLGKYGPEATEDDRHALLRAVMGIGADAAAIIPASMSIDFEQAMAGSSSADLYLKFGDWTDRQVSKAVLGQTMSTDEGGRGGRAQAEVHDGLRDEIRDADAKALARTINESTIRDFVDLNYGPQKTYPALWYQTQDGVDLTEFVDNVCDLVDRGLDVATSEIYAKMGLTEPKAGDKVLRPLKGDAPTPDAAARPAQADTQNADAMNAIARALNRMQVRPSEAAIDALTSELNNDWEAATAPILSPLMALAQNSQTAEGFLAALDGVLDGMDGDALAQLLATATTKARAHGDVED
jgi:phage gp29-like protein